MEEVNDLHIKALIHAFEIKYVSHSLNRRHFFRP